MTRQRRGPTPIGGVLVGLMLAFVPGVASSGPDPGAAGRAVVLGPSRAAGDLIGGVGLIGAAGIATAGDLASLVDDNRRTRPWLRGGLSRTVKVLALGLSVVSTTALEVLRLEDIERLPEAREAYLEAAPFVGRVDTILSGLAAIRLSLGDLCAAPALAALHLSGARDTAERWARRRDEARIVALGPSPLEGPPGPVD